MPGKILAIWRSQIVREQIFLATGGIPSVYAKENLCCLVTEEHIKNGDGWLATGVAIGS